MNKEFEEWFDEQDYDFFCITLIKQRQEQAWNAALEKQGQHQTGVSFAEPNQLEAGWISVKDNLPDDSDYYLIYCLNINQVIRFGSYDALEMEWIDHDGEKFYNVTHWRKLPDPPKQ